ncbi:NAD(P)H-binding protein [Rhodococcus sp. NPDC006774]|uniref:SDR family oxidoreductase n=1 Tax=Rhodococcus sp. NPDC006774 TaxID=3157186 RepID=UPI0033DB22E7
MKLAVAGGTGTVGVHVVEVARQRGHEVVVLSRSAGVDLVSGSGLSDALAGVDAVVDVASTQTISAKESMSFFAAVTRNLLTAEGAAGVGHHVALSIVGIDRAPHSYYAGKVEQERIIRAGTVPWTILRATQFHEFAGQIRAHDQ